MAYLFRVTAKQEMCAVQTGRMIPKGASVEIVQNYPNQPFPHEIQEAFLRKYGVSPQTWDIQGRMIVEKL